MPNDIDVWIWSNPGHTMHARELDNTLSPEEEARAERFVYRRDAERFRSRRVRVRQILAEYLSVEPRAISFLTGSHGKPFLHPAHNSDLQFNLSHSEDMAVFAVAHGLELGVDVEWIRPIEEQIAERFFSTAEKAALSKLPPEWAVRGFFECWTGKEAFVKARGAGLSIPLDSFDVSVGPGTASTILRIGGDAPDDQRDWHLWRFEPAAGLLCAVAARTAGQPWELKVRTSG
jgi:4'-phosphopantetheinyl transferase